MGFRTSSARRSSAQSAVASSYVILPPSGSSGPTLSGSGTTANTVVQKQIVQEGQTTTQSTSVSSSVKVTSVFVTDSSFNILDDTALDPAGGYLKIIGIGFATGCAVYLNGSSVTTTFISSTELRVTTPSTAAGTYNLMVFNSDGNGAIYLNLGVSNFPTYTTSAGSLGTVYETNDYTQSVVATGDAPLTYSLYSGTLPPGATLASNGVISGTSTVENSSNTYSFVINVKDAQGQDTTRSFSLTINTDAITWSSPANNAVITLEGGTVMSNVSLSATSAAGKSITYTANSLPTGVLLSGNTIYGTPNTEQTVYTELTATSATTNRTAKQYISWSINLGDAFLKYTTLLLSAKTTMQSAPFHKDNSTNNHNITVAGDSRASIFNPYQNGYYSNYFDGTGDYLTVASSSGFAFGTGDFTVEGWTYVNAIQSTASGIFQQAPTAFQADVLNSVAFGTVSTGQVWQIYAKNTNNNSTATWKLNTWYHFAVVRSSTTTTLYINGTAVITVTGDSTNYTGTYFGIGSIYGTTYSQMGYISNVRVLKGTALYTTNFTPPIVPLTAIANTQLLTCQSNRLVDTSSNALAITRSGDVSITQVNPFPANTAYSTYGSGYFDGSGDYLEIPHNTNQWVGASTNFTLECWVYIPSSLTGERIILSKGYQGTPNYGQFVLGVGTTAAMRLIFLATTSGSNWEIQLDDTTALSPNLWYHVAVVRNGSTITMYKNGVSVATGTNSGALYNHTGTIRVASHSSGSQLNGYVTDARWIVGSAVYTTAFTPPTAPLTAIANTQLLTCQTNGSHNNSVFNDTSGFNNLISRAGNVTNGTFSPYGDNWSVYFDGSGDYLSVPTSGNQLDATGDFTTEMWIYWNSMPTTGYQNICGQGALGQNSYGLSAGNATESVWSAPYKFKLNIANVGDVLVGNTTLVAGQWYHLAHTRTSGVHRLFVNGVLQTTTPSTYTDSTSRGFAGNAFTIGNNSNCYISNFRYIKGTSLYTATFTPSTAPFTAVANTQLLTCNSNRFFDGSPNNLTITKNGDLSVRKFSAFSTITVPKYYSTYFDGSGDYMTLAANVAFGFGTGDFTVEMWFYPTSTKGVQMLFDTRDNGNTAQARYNLVLNNNTSMCPRISQGSTALITSSTAVSVNSWYHIAFTRSGTTLSLFLNGTLVGSTTSSLDVGASASPCIATVGDARGTYDGYYQGYISNLRVLKGTALYTAGFTPPVSPLIPIANTSLLACQSNTLIDNSNNIFNITAAGDAKPLAVSPFTVTANSSITYSANTFGGSMYFDGSGDYLQIANNPNHASLGTSDFTLEFWFNHLNVSGTQYLVSHRVGAYVPFLFWTATGTLTYYVSSDNGSWNLKNGTSLGTIVPGQWYHLAYTRNGSTFRVFLNGVQVDTFTSAASFTATGNPLNIGASSTDTNAPFAGHISDVRFIRGKSLYDANFVPPSVPLLSVGFSNNSTSIVNTGHSVVNVTGTSGAIIDASRNTVLETVGDVKLTTSSYPYSSAGQSYYFDGTGDYLITPATNNYSLGITDFTIEFWVKTSATTAYMTPLRFGDTWTTGSWAIYLNDASGNGNPSFWSYTLNTSYVTSGALVNNGSWNHIAFVRSGSSFVTYINGISRGTLTNANTIGEASGRLWIGRDSGNIREMTGNIADLRISKYARYTTTFTVPSGPLSEK